MIISNNFMLQKKWKQTTAFLSKSNGNVSTQLQYGPRSCQPHKNG